MQGEFLPGVVVAVSLSAVHEFSKPVQQSIRLLVGLGVEGDAHLGVEPRVLPAAGEAGVAARAFEGIAGSALAAEKDKAQFLAAAAGQYYHAKDYAKSADLAGRYFKAGGNDKGIHTLRVQALYLGNNFALAAKELLADIQAGHFFGQIKSELDIVAFMRRQFTFGQNAHRRQMAV